MENEELRGGMSRRTAIKSVAAGTALVWAAPAITTMGGSAFAQQSPRPVCRDVGDWTCGELIVECGASGPFALCVCDESVEGNSFCWENFACDGARVCASTSDCPAGWACATTCCGQTCAPPCSTEHTTTTTDGLTAAG